MRDRVKSLKRVLAVQQQMVKLAEWRLGKLQQQCEALRADQTRLHEFVASGDMLSPLLSVAAFKTGQALTGAITRREAEAASQSRHTDAMRRREKLAEKIVDKAAVDADQEREKRDLVEIIEAFRAPDDASFP